MTTTITNNNSKVLSPESIPDYSRVAIVPVANPKTASELLHLACALSHPTDGKVIALVVSVGDMEGKAKTTAELTKIIEDIEAEGHEIALEVLSATSIARGIIDASRQFGADLIILGMKQAIRGQVVLGTIVESVVETSPCDVLIYRQSPDPDFDRVIISVDLSSQTQVAARIGIRLAKSYNARIEAMYAQSSNRSQFEGLARIEQALADIPGREAVKRTLITAQDAVESILTRTTEDDLIIIGFSARSDLGMWLTGDMARGILERAEGPVMIVARSNLHDDVSRRMWRRFVGWLHPVLTRLEQEEIIRQSQVMSSLHLDYVILIIISATLATLGLLLNSAAVIIGAMLVAPLMSPLISLSAGLAVGRVIMARRALGTLAFGVSLALLVAAVIGVVLPASLPTSEMLARGNPTLLDAGVALASGVVGAYATARKDIPAALAGVAIAAALMPPLCTVGLGLAFGNLSLAFGASVLFITNIICIILAGVVVFFWLGMSIRDVPNISPLVQRFALGLLLLVTIPVAVELVILTRNVQQDTAIRHELEDSLADAELIEFQINRGDEKRITAVVRSQNEITFDQVMEIQERIGGELGETVYLELIVQPVLRLVVDPVNDAPLTSDPLPETTLEALIMPETTAETTAEPDE